MSSKTESNNEESSMSGMNFPTKLYKFLSNVEELNIEHIVSWQPHGRCFRIHDIKEFVKLTNPSWFTYSKYSSFQRQLNIYGFQRILKGPDKNCYYHKHFLRGYPHLIPKIDRIPLKKDYQTQSLSHPVPDFYSMPSLTKGIQHVHDHERSGCDATSLNRDSRDNSLRLMNLSSGDLLSNNVCSTYPIIRELDSSYYPPYMTGNTALLQSILQCRQSNFMQNASIPSIGASPSTMLQRLQLLQSLSGGLSSHGDMRPYLSTLPTSLAVSESQRNQNTFFPSNTASTLQFDLNAVVASRIRAPNFSTAKFENSTQARW